MVERQQARQDPRLDAVFFALSDGTRRRMLRNLSEGERSIGELAEPFDMSLAAASKHVKALERAGLVQREIRGRMHLCRLDAKPLSTANDWLQQYERFWSTSLDKLEDLLRRELPATPKPSSPRKRK
jgi:DNA-binding transcriptional ArsR family regulator